MATPRLPFLYPFLFAPIKPATVRSSSRTARRTFTATSRKRQSPAHQRYGTANEPAPHLSTHRIKPHNDDNGPKNAKESVQPRSELQKGRAQEAASRASPKGNGAQGTAAATAIHTAEEGKAIEALPPTTRPVSQPGLDAAEPIPLAGPSPPPQIHTKPLETVLNLSSSDQGGMASSPVYTERAPVTTNTATSPPSAGQEQQQQSTQSPPQQAQQEQQSAQPLEQQRPPHISTPPYVHHFDTYDLVRRLEEGGWTTDQAITLMKAVRLTLSTNMDLAHHGLVSKSNVENETYLFSAACSELKTEIQTKRKAEGERSRTDRTQLQHEVDILGQRMTQESATMKDELKGMFDDRKMAVRNEQRDMERKVQELNYRITVSLNSDSRSDVEMVRWIITKRAITALAICVGLILGSIKFSSSVAQWEEEERKMLHAARNKKSNNYADRGSDAGGDWDGSPRAGGRGGSANGGNGAGNGGGSDPNMSGRDELGQGEILVQQGDNPAFVSLG